MNIYEATFKVGKTFKNHYILAETFEIALVEASTLSNKSASLSGVKLVIEDVYYDLARLVKRAEEFAKVKDATS